MSAEIYQDAVTRGLYHDALRRWTAYFPPEQILVLQYERCIADPFGELARTYRFLGLDPFVFQGIRNRVNPTTHTINLDQDVRRRLVELYTPDVRALSEFTNIDLTLWLNFLSPFELKSEADGPAPFELFCVDCQQPTVPHFPEGANVRQGEALATHTASHRR